ncbi:MAG: hypothetical protein COB85_04830 [Bacteroidetes bacterium]|nr:MAG: hypothetical protein COB85_04830 [Bacteroidota bacterium]
MKWKKKGLLFSPENQGGWMKSHAQIPTPLVMGDILRIYFASRPKQTHSMTSFVDFDINDLTKVVYVHDEPVLQLGEPGTFDEHGIMPASVIEKDGLIYLYYSGWQRSVGVLYNNYTGVAISEDGGKTFKRYKQGPCLDRTPDEIFSATSPCVLEVEGEWHAWYSSGTNWHEINGKLEHTYDLKYAHSNDGLTWVQPNKIGIKQVDEFEALCMPAIIKLDNVYHMWYSYRGSDGFRQGSDESYTLGYAKSNDLKEWQRDDAIAGIELSETGWDSQMMAYPSICRVKDQVILFYNGNEFGEDGFGWAVLEE